MRTAAPRTRPTPRRTRASEGIAGRESADVGRFALARSALIELWIDVAAVDSETTAEDTTEDTVLKDETAAAIVDETATAED